MACPNSKSMNRDRVSEFKVDARKRSNIVGRVRREWRKCRIGHGVVQRHSAAKLKTSLVITGNESDEDKTCVPVVRTTPYVGGQCASRGVRSSTVQGAR
jgi:hypothetical protein